MTLLDRLERKTNKDKITNCWLWIGSTNAQGYGRILVNGKNKYVHKIAYDLLVKKTTNLILHKNWICSNKNCWNPEHLYDGNHSQNRHDCIEKYGHNLINRSHCINGHEYTEINTKIKKNGHRVCITCFNKRNEKLKIWLKNKRG